MEERKGHLQEIMKCVRFANISSYYFCDKVSTIRIHILYSFGQVSVRQFFLSLRSVQVELVDTFSLSFVDMGQKNQSVFAD